VCVDILADELHTVMILILLCLLLILQGVRIWPT